MTSYSYAAAYLNDESRAMLLSLGLAAQRFHVTTCFDSSGRLDPSALPQSFAPQTAMVSSVAEWDAPNGRYVVAELSDCAWTAEANASLLALGVVEDLPHRPHLTLISHCQRGDALKLQSLVGATLVFDRHEVRRKPADSLRKKASIQ